MSTSAAPEPDRQRNTGNNADSPPTAQQNTESGAHSALNRSRPVLPPANSRQLSGESFGISEKSAAILAAPPLPDIPAPNRSFISWGKRSIARLLARFSHTLAASWLHKSGASIGDRIDVACSIAVVDDLDADAIQQKFSIGNEPYLTSLAEQRPLDAFKALKKLHTDNNALVFCIVDRALEAQAGEAVDLLSEDLAITPLQSRYLWNTLRHAEPLLALTKTNRFQGLQTEEVRDALSSLIQTDPCEVISSMCSLPPLDGVQLELLGCKLAEESHLFLLENIDNLALTPPHSNHVWSTLYNCQPHLALKHVDQFSGITQSEITAALTDYIEREPRDVLLSLDSLPELSEDQQLLLADALVGTTNDYSSLLDTIRKIPVSERICFEIAQRLAQSEARRIIAATSSTFKFEDRSYRQQLFQKLIESDPKETLEHLTSLLDWCGNGVLPASLPSSLTDRYWLRITTNRERLGIRDSSSLKEMLFRKLETHSGKVAKSVSLLQLANEPWKDEFATALARRQPDHVKSISSALEIDNQRTLNQLFREYAEVEPIPARAWARRSNIELDGHSKQILSESLMRNSPWKALKELLKENDPDQKLLSKVAVYCARNNASRMCREFATIPLKQPSARAKVFAECAKRNTWVTIKHAAVFLREGNEGAEQVFRIASRKDPIRALKHQDSLGKLPQAAIRSALAYAVKKNASQSLKLLATEDLPEEIETEYACVALRKNPRVFSEIATGLLADKNSINRAHIVAAAVRGDIKKLPDINRHLRRLQMPIDQQLISAFALEKFAAAQENAPEEFKTLFNQRAFVLQVVSTGLVAGRWDSALEAARHLSHLESAQGEVIDTNAALSILDSTTEQLSNLDALTDNERSNLNLLKKIRHAQCIPTDTLQRTLDHFGEDDFKFLFDVLQQGGSTVAESTFELLLAIYGMECDIQPLDEKIILECISLGFRGLSPKLLKDLRPVFSESVYEGRSVLRNYQALAGQILQGLPVPAKLERSPLYPGLVTEAFRPVGMTEGGVKRELENIKDNSAHLGRFSFPKAGYPVRLAQAGRITVQPGHKVDIDALGSIQKSFQTSEEEVQSMPSHLLLIRLLEGAFDQLDSRKLWSTFQSNCDDPRLADCARQVANVDLSDSTPRKILETIGTMGEALSVVAYDAAMSIANTATTEGADDALRITKKIAAHTRRILKLPQKKKITRKELLIAIDLQAQKLFKQQRATLASEAGKFNQHVGTLKDRYVMYLSKSKPAYFGRAGAGLCTARETWSWNSKDFLQMMLVDTHRHLIVGNIQLHLFKDNQGKDAVLARINPTSTFLRRADGKTLAKEMLAVVRQFAKENNLIPYLPEQTAWHQLTNRGTFAPYLKAYYGKQSRAAVQITRHHTVREIYQLRDEPKT